MPVLSPNAAVLSNKFYVDNDQMRDNTYDNIDKQAQTRSNGSSMIHSSLSLRVFLEIHSDDK